MRNEFKHRFIPVQIEPVGLVPDFLEVLNSNSIHLDFPELLYLLVYDRVELWNASLTLLEGLYLQVEDLGREEPLPKPLNDAFSGDNVA